MGHKEDRNDVWGCCPTVEDFGEKLTWKFFGHARAVKLENVFKYISDTILDRNDCDSWSILADMKQWRLIRQEPQIMNAARKRLATFLSSLAS